MCIRDRNEIDELLRRDHAHAWHPYAPVRNALPAYPVLGASGVRLRLADGRELIDGMSSWWAAIHGYNHPLLNRALTDQLSRMAHVMFGGLTHPSAVELCELLSAITPGKLEHVFLGDSGSVAVEVAIKMALQYWQSRGIAGRTRILALRGAYHGDTFMAMSVCDPLTGMHHLFRGAVAEQLFAPRPLAGFEETDVAADRAAFVTQLREHAGSIAAVILEPVVQGAGGMHFYSPAFLREVRTLCDENDVLLIADEIATGFGRTGRLFACEHAAIAPDILCLGKALTGGYRPPPLATASPSPTVEWSRQKPARGSDFPRTPPATSPAPPTRTSTPRAAPPPTNRRFHDGAPGRPATSYRPDRAAKPARNNLWNG